MTFELDTSSDGFECLCRELQRCGCLVQQDIDT